MQKYPQNQSYVDSSGQTLTTNVSMTLCNWRIRHQTPCVMWLHYIWYRIKIRSQSNTVPTPTVAWTRVWLLQRGGGTSLGAICSPGSQRFQSRLLPPGPDPPHRSTQVRRDEGHVRQGLPGPWGRWFPWGVRRFHAGWSSPPFCPDTEEKPVPEQRATHSIGQAR